MRSCVATFDKPRFLPIAYSELNPECVELLNKRMDDGCLHKAPVFGDIERLCEALETMGDTRPDLADLRKKVVATLGEPGMPRFDVLVGGWPCQGISCAGLGKGLDDHRSGLFFCLARLLKIYAPPYFFFENVASIAGDTKTWRSVLETLIQLGYSVDWIILPVPLGLVKRCRCFFLGVKTSAEKLKVTQAFRERMHEKPRWLREAEPTLEDQLMHIKEYKRVAPRLKMMGNMVIPDQGRVALGHLICAA